MIEKPPVSIGLIESTDGDVSTEHGLIVYSSDSEHT